jgi:DNA-binding GntR family transcriptional regulator
VVLVAVSAGRVLRPDPTPGRAPSEPPPASPPPTGENDAVASPRGHTCGNEGGRARALLEQAILSGEIAPGTVLRQEQLSARYAVSRTPVREALRRLAALGLVSFVPNRGVRIRTFSRDELREAFLVRAELESLATAVAVPRFGGLELAELEAAEERFKGLTDELRDRGGGDGRPGLVADWVRANHNFHDVIYAVARLPVVERLAKGARFSGSAVWAPADAHELAELYDANEREHQAIIAAIRAGSAAGARSLAREHVLASGRLLERIMTQRWQRSA